MSQKTVYAEILTELQCHLPAEVDASSQQRLAVLVTGIISSQSASPARIARALARLGLRQATVESLERTVRRIENDPDLEASLTLHPFARAHLLLGKPERLLLVIDPTSQDDRVTLLTVGVHYRGRLLPLAWAAWPANSPLKGLGFWQRVTALLALVAQLLPPNVPVIWLADRAFGTPTFIDLLLPYGWDYIVRTQGQTRFRDTLGREHSVASLVAGGGQRAKRRGWLYKKQGWRAASLVVVWGKCHRSPLCLVSSLPPDWCLAHLYRQRYGIEATFRDFKSHGWHWEQGQVRDLAHLERLLVGMALASWLTLMAGTQVATHYLAQTPSAQRRTRPFPAKFSLFQLGLDHLLAALHRPLPLIWRLSHWLAPNWQQQLTAHHVRAFIFSTHPLFSLNPVRP